MLRTSELMNH